MEKVTEFEHTIAEFYGAKHGVAVDCCTHAIELCLRLNPTRRLLKCPKHTYISVPFTLMKLGQRWEFSDDEWEDRYRIFNTPIIDGAVSWRENSYQPGTLLCLSFQHKKHLSLGRGGMILLDDQCDANHLRRMAYDGRERAVPWADQNITEIGYHYYMTPETAELGLARFASAAEMPVRHWSWRDYPDLTQMSVFADAV
jgi:dTDP-4-amino-4,6-dideoxygalactose transaminase